MKLVLIFILVLGASYCGDLLPEDIKNPQKDNSYVGNPDMILRSRDIVEINDIISQMEGLQIIVLVISKIPDNYLTTSNDRHYDYGQQVFNLWKIGADNKHNNNNNNTISHTDVDTDVEIVSDRNNGVLIFITVSDKEYRIITGTAATQILTQESCNYIIHREYNTLKRKKYQNVILESLDYIDRLTKGEDLQSFTIQEKLAFWIGLIYLIVFLVMKYRSSDKFLLLESNLKLLQKQDREQFGNYIRSNCPVCLQSFSHPQEQYSCFLIKRDEEDSNDQPLNDLIQLPDCGHQLHKSCLEKWHKKIRTCPLCTTDFSITEKQDIPLSNLDVDHHSNQIIEQLIQIQFKLCNVSPKLYKIDTETPNQSFTFQKI